MNDYDRAVCDEHRRDLTISREREIRLRQELEASRAETREQAIELVGKLEAARGEVDRLKGELAAATNRDALVSKLIASNRDREEARAERDRLSAECAIALTSLETAEGLLREETDACVCETIDPRDVGRTVTSQTQVACGECWWCRVRAFLAGRGGSPTAPGPDADVWKWTCSLCGYFVESVEESEMRTCRGAHLVEHTGGGSPAERADECVCPFPRERCPECAHACAACALASKPDERAPLSTGGGPPDAPVFHQDQRGMLCDCSMPSRHRPEPSTGGEKPHPCVPMCCRIGGPVTLDANGVCPECGSSPAPGVPPRGMASGYAPHDWTGGRPPITEQAAEPGVPPEKEPR